MYIYIYIYIYIYTGLAGRVPIAWETGAQSKVKSYQDTENDICYLLASQST